jgi:glycosidase
MDRFHSTKKDNKFNKKNFLKEKVTDHSIYGGNIKGVIEKLDYIKNLGFNGIYFNPIFLSPTSHKYDTIDYLKIDPSFGTEKDFEILIKEAHKRNIKIILDAVFNHIG